MQKKILVLGLVLGMINGWAKPPNILFISADDLNNDLGVYGNPQVKTPHLERLAEMGVRFDKAYCQQPLCGPSRASVMTGLRPNTTGFVGNKNDLRQLRPNVETMGQFFQKQGYYVARVGKVYHYNNPGSIGSNGNDDALTWQERFNPVGIDKQQEEKIIRFPGGKTGRKGGLGISMAYWDPVSEDEDHTDGKVASKVIELIKEHKDEPFFIAAGFYNPHCPYVAPKKYFDLYPMDEITMQPLDEAKKELEDVPPMAVQRDTNKRWPYYFKGVTVDEARKCKQAYYACNSFVDAQVGRLIDALEKNGLLENTLIVFWSDHGYFLGEKGLWFKRKNFERSARVPLLIAGPGISQGQVNQATVELLDLYPTLVDISGFEVPEQLDGSSLRPLLKNPATVWNKPAFTQVVHNANAQGYSIRTDDWRYTEWYEKSGRIAGTELYDHKNDPDEVTNLAKNPKHKTIIADLKAKLEPFASTRKNLRFTKNK
ncbi:MAG: sulfatase [Verrucomicrobiota bacterium]